MAMLNNQMVHHAYQFLGPKHRIFAKDWTFFWTSDPDPDPPRVQVFVESSSCEEVWQLLLAVPEYPAAHCHLRIQII